MRDGWICGKIAEANNHVLNECRKYVQKENERRYDWIGIKIQGECHWKNGLGVDGNCLQRLLETMQEKALARSYETLLY